MVEIICKQCEKTALKKANKKYPPKYCCRDCWADAHYGNRTDWLEFKTRNPKFLEMVELCRSGVSQEGAARILGLHSQTVVKWFAKYGAENILGERFCEFCGKLLLGTAQLTHKKYCNDICSRRANRAEKNPEAFAMRWAAARLTESQSPEQWKEILSAGAPEGDYSPVHIISEPRNGTLGANSLAAFVYDLLKRDPCDGEIYAFCSLTREQISTVYWSAGAFVFTKYSKAYGSYIWPNAQVGTQIEIRKNEFEYLLSLRKTNGKFYFPPDFT